MLKKIVLPEGNDDRIKLAAKILLEKQIAHPILIGDVDVITDYLGKSNDYTALPVDDSLLIRLKEEALAKNKEFEVDAALVQGAALVRDGEADGIVAGAVSSTPHVLKSYFKTIGLAEGISRAASCFWMKKGQDSYLFADCGLNIDPDAEMLAETAYLCDQFASLVGIEPKTAFLSFSTYGSAKHESVDKIKNALTITKERHPDMLVDGELQVDAAIVPAVASLKAPDSPLKGRATVLIFPDLNSGNIAYKIAERFGGYSATGPLLLGFAKPAHDLSRGCSADDVVSAVEVALLQCKVDD